MILFLQQLQQQHLSNMLWSENHSEQVKALWKANNTLTNIDSFKYMNSTYNNYHNNDDDIVPLFLPYDFILHHFIYVIVCVVVVLTILYITFIQYFDTIMKFLLYNNSNNSNSHNDASSRTTITTSSSSSSSSSSYTSTSSSTSSATSISTKIIKSFTIQQKYKLCYQMTNCITNLCLGCFGLYYEYYYNYSTNTTTTTNSNNIHNNNHHYHYLLLSIRPPPNYSILTSITNYDHCIYMSALQIGYQLWSIPMGIYIIHEPISMIIHHISVIICSSMSGLLLYGFRFYTPFFYGIVEISSIPLAIMNAFKDHPYTLQYYYPNIYLTIRIVFAITFLYIRIIMFLPRKYYFLRDQILLWTSINERYNYTNNSTSITSSNTQYYTILLYQCFMAIVSFSAFFLLLLQTYWAVLIVKGIFHIATGKNRSKNIASNNGTQQHVSKQQEQQQQQSHHDNHSIITTKPTMNGNHSNNNTNNHICDLKVRINGKHD